MTRRTQTGSASRPAEQHHPGSSSESAGAAIERILVAAVGGLASGAAHDMISWVFRHFLGG